MTPIILNAELKFSQSKSGLLCLSLQDYDMNIFMDTDKEVIQLEEFINNDKKHFYPFGAHFSIDLNLIKTQGQLFFEMNYESGRRERHAKSFTSTSFKYNQELY